MFIVATAQTLRNDGHHRMLAEKMAVSKGLLKRYAAELRAGLARFDFGKEILMLRGRNGDAFNLLTMTLTFSLYTRSPVVNPQRTRLRRHGHSGNQLPGEGKTNAS